MIVPLDFAWHLFVADATGLPAVHRRLEEMPAGTRAIVLLQVEAADRRQFATAADLQLHWFDDGETLLAAVEALHLPAGEGFAWGAGEAAAMVRVRNLLLEKGQPKEAMRVAAYWRQGQADYHEELSQ
jgi:NADPH-dependent ferric siderophore reductase